MTSPPPLLTPEHLAQLSRAAQLYRPLRRARTVALFDAWSLAIFAALTLLTGYSSISGLLISLALALVAAIEFHGAKLISSLDPRAPLLLASNQLLLGASIILYSVWNLIDLHLHPGHLLDSVSSSLTASDLQGIDSLAQFIVTWLYVTLIAIAILLQGGTALFYLSRRKHLQTYLAEVPDWARTLRQ